MMNRLAQISVCTYLQTITYFRIKEAFFFAFIFPVFLFILFGYIWGSSGNVAYVRYLFTGVVGMTITSDALFGIGPVIKMYRDNNILKFLNNIPSGLNNYLIGLFISRIIVMLLAIAITGIISHLAFKLEYDFMEVALLIVGVILGTFLFAFLGLFVSFQSKAESGKSGLNFIFFVMLFMSGSFFPLNNLHPVVKAVANAFPLTHLLTFIRGEVEYIWFLFGWTILFYILFHFASKRTVKR
jgi:ABC-2 type transport system permease protein